MLTQLEVRNERVQLSPLSFADGSASADPIQILGIDGIGPVAATINTEEYSDLDGEYFSGASVGKRNIVLTLGLNPQWGRHQTVADLRLMLYAYFMPKNTVTLTFHSTHLPTCEISGYVESLEPNIFSQDPQVQVSILCPDPYFTDVNESFVDGVCEGVGSVNRAEIAYLGSVPTGMILEIFRDTANNAGEIEIINESPNAQIMTINGQVDSSRKIMINTTPRQKYVRRVTISTGNVVNLLGALDRSSKWIQIQPGTNRFAVLTNPTGQIWRMRYHNKFGGL